MMEKLRKYIKKLFKEPGFWILLTALVLMLVGPFILTRSLGIIDFSKTGQIGDTIGGLTAPIINFAAAILVYLAFKEQVKANEIVNTNLENEKIERSKDRNSRILEEMAANRDVRFNHSMSLISLASDEVTNFTYYVPGTLKSYQGMYAIKEVVNKLSFSDTNPTNAILNPSITELIDLLKLIESNIDFIENARLNEEQERVLVKTLKYIYSSKVNNGLRSFLHLDLTSIYLANTLGVTDKSHYAGVIRELHLKNKRSLGIT